MDNMKKIASFLIFTLLWVFPGGLSAMEELEIQYRDQLAYYNREILSHLEAAAEKQEMIGIVASFKEKAMVRGAAAEYRLAEEREHQTYREVLYLKDRIIHFKSKRDELKRKVIKENGSLPDWWVEPELEKDILCRVFPVIFSTLS